MSGSTLKSALAEVWYLVVVLAVIALVVVYKIAVGGEAAPVGEKPGAAVSPGATAVAPAAAVQPVRLSEADKAKAAIADYEKRITEDTQSNDVPACLLAMGNLYKQKLKNYKEAARNYELLIKDHPDWINAGAAYTQLMSCYELLEDQEGLRWLYSQMMEKFPPESNEYKYAQAKMQ